VRQDDRMTTAMVGLLRGINVGGKTKLAMADLRRIAEECGYTDVRTYIQSGNVVFASPGKDPAKVARTLQDAIAAAGLAVQPDVIVRTRAELAGTIDRNPFLTRGEDPAALHVVFVGGSGKVTLGLDDPERFLPEEAAVVGRDVYLFLPNGMGRSKLAAALARPKGPVGTARNWRTVLKLAEMADATDLG
jgi:uncharacterized protein (DUF1697 family)